MAWEAVFYMILVESCFERLEMSSIAKYQAKSKWTHPTYSSIREITEFEADGDPKIIALTYGQCNFEFKLLELTDFFRSSVWTTFQIFHSCMFEALPLTREESDSCAAFDRVFQNWPQSNLI